MSFASLRKVVRSARKGLCPTCSKTRYPQLEAAGAGHVGCLIYTLEVLGTLVKDEHDVTAMHVAARKGHISILIYLVEKKLVEGTPRAKNNATPAHDAAGTGNLECLRYIITQTMASPNDVDQNNATPLHWAVQAGHLKIVQWLVIDAKAAVDTMAKNGMTLLHLAASKNYLDIVHWLTLHLYKTHSKPRRLINAKDKNGATPIYHAARVGHVAIIKWLAEKGGDPTIFTVQGMAPIHAAATTGQLEAVRYLFQFGSATAPGGLRTTQGASSLHCAAAEGHHGILEWLMADRKCTGNERDYYQSTPLHDAAENGHVRIIEFLCNNGADCTLTDIEGNSAYDVAIKNGQSRAANALSTLMKKETLRRNNGMVQGDDNIRSRGITRSRTSQAQMVDNYRNAPPHQPPVSVFDEEMDPYDDEDEDEYISEGDEWTTLRDVLGDDEIKQISHANLSNEDLKRRKLEEEIQREKEERQRKRQELMKKETEYEQEIRERILAEERLSKTVQEQVKAGKAYEVSQKQKKKRNSAPAAPKLIGNLSAPSPSQRITLPGSISAHELSRGLVDKRGPTIEPPPLAKDKKKKWWSRKSSNPTPQTQKMKSSKSWDSSVSTARYEGSDDFDGEIVEDGIPEPPPLPTIEYLLGKKPVNLRKRFNQSLKDQLKEGATQLKNSSRLGGESGGTEDSDETSSVGSSRGSSKGRHRHRRGAKHRRKRKDEEGEGSGEWTHSKLNKTASPRKALERKPTPMPSKVPVSDIIGKPSSLETSSHHTATPTNGPTSNPSPGMSRNKRGGPKLPPHQQNKPANQQQPAPSVVSPITKVGNNRGKSQVQNRGNPTAGRGPQLTRQEGHLESNSDPDLTIDDMELQLVEMKTRLVHASANSMQGNIRPPSAEIHNTSDEDDNEESESESDESSEYTSTSDTSSSSGSDDSSESSDEELQMKKPLMPKRLMMVRNPVGAAAAAARGRTGGGGTSRGFNRQRMLSRYPRLFRRRIINLDTITEQAEEALYEHSSSEERAVIFHRIQKEKLYMTAWRKYMVLMKIANKKADKIVQKKRKENLAKAFYAWIQGRNMGAVDNEERAQLYYKKKLTRKVYRAWRNLMPMSCGVMKASSLQHINTEELYLNWLNAQLEAALGKQVDNISSSLADGTLIIHAISYASGKKSPKFNHKPKVRLHRQDNWKTAHSYMSEVGINMNGIEPADLANEMEAAIHNMFNTILKWHRSRQH